MYAYKQNKGVFIVGFYDSNGRWNPESDHDTAKEAANWVIHLNESLQNKKECLKECLRCGYCCIQYDVMIIDNPKAPRIFAPDNIILKPHGEQCKHLKGETVGKYSCDIHDMPWFRELPCSSYPSETCKIGKFLKERV